MIITKYDDCPKDKDKDKDKDTCPTSPNCSKCKEFITKKWFDTGNENTCGVACKMAIEQWELETYFRDKPTEGNK